MTCFFTLHHSWFSKHIPGWMEHPNTASCRPSLLGTSITMQWHSHTPSLPIRYAPHQTFNTPTQPKDYQLTYVHTYVCTYKPMLCRTGTHIQSCHWRFHRAHSTALQETSCTDSNNNKHEQAGGVGNTLSMQHSEGVQTTPCEFVQYLLLSQFHCQVTAAAHQK